jgi:hypothetical protein
MGGSYGLYGRKIQRVRLENLVVEGRTILILLLYNYNFTILDSY